MIRIQKHLSLTGTISRREGVRLIKEGRITINGVHATHTSTVDQDSVVLLDGQPLKRKKCDIYLLLHKPVGITSTAQKKVEGNIIDFLDFPERIFPVGRLDKQSEGLILMTNDGDIVNKLMKSEFQHEKEYMVTVNRPFSDWFLEKMAEGVDILGQKTLPCQVERVSDDTFTIVLTQGLNRQIRRMTKVFDYRVERLIRIRILDFSLDGLAPGEWRELTEEEVNQLKARLGSTSS
ncbi:23S rRNA pseudouridine2604 synthase [Halalkalibacter nanhaiisediminis]|uniref:Pseudouridine synthase n=1 Tax=Halalkalibacter nanhaiisediminis TaxID=688079 RepID=A0A562QEA5_9BACI|nr:23S rRNA pseudouridine2604 synthase [Halalkalibacter nanhaiisediminis]